MHTSDFAFANDVRAAVDLRTPRTGRLLVQVVLALVFVGIVWANFAVLDEVTRGVGRVVPSRQMQLVQPLEGGIVSAILVREGAIVQQGQVVVRIDDTGFGAQLGEVRERRAAMAARVGRLEAEIAGGSALQVADELREGFERLVASEQSLLEARARRLQQDIEVVRQQEEQRHRERDELRAQEQRLTQQLALLTREYDLTRRLHASRVVPEIEMLRIERQLVDVRGQLEVARASLARIDLAIREAEARRAAVTSTFRAGAEEELVRSRSDLSVLEETIRAARDRVQRADLRAPAYGIVNRVNVATVGAVVQSGQSIIEIVPLDDTLLVEAQIRPADIAFIRPDHEAVVKITAYDATVYGSLHGRVERISADTTTNDSGETFYRVSIRTTRSYLGTEAQPLPIMPGMLGTVEVLTGRKSVFEYLMRPLRRVAAEAFRER